MTKTEQNIAACQRHGFLPVEIRSKKYICYKHPTAEIYYLLGSHRAVRYNRSPKVEDSIAVRFSGRFISEGDAK